MMRKLVLTWVALLVLLALTAGSALLPLGPWNSVINLAVALAKGVLVALIFMRLAGGAAVLRLAAVAGLFTLALLFLLWSADYFTRQRATPAPYQTPRTVSPALGSEP